MGAWASPRHSALVHWCDFQGCGRQGGDSHTVTSVTIKGSFVGVVIIQLLRNHRELLITPGQGG